MSVRYGGDAGLCTAAGLLHRASEVKSHTPGLCARNVALVVTRDVFICDACCALFVHT